MISKGGDASKPRRGHSSLAIAKPRAAILRGMLALAALLSGIGLSSPVAAEGQSAEMQAHRDADQDRKRLVADHLPLTPSEAQHFWPLYDRYQTDVSDLVGKRMEIIGKLGEHYDSMTDALARQLTVDNLELQEARLRLIKSYLPKFEKVLPGKKLARYYQIEAKIRAAVDAEIAERIPLIQ